VIYLTWLVNGALLYSKGDNVTVFVKEITVICVVNYTVTF